MVQILLALAVLIAVLGVVDTLALSVLERTRELGLVRAVGLTRGQTLWMVSAEAVIIAFFGALLGVVSGSGLGAAAVRALHANGITTPVRRQAIISAPDRSRAVASPGATGRENR